jgi:hypothetical protein
MIPARHLPPRRRYIYGLPYWVARLVGLDMFGLGIGLISFQLYFFFGLGACCLFNCCGRARVVQRAAAQAARPDALPRHGPDYQIETHHPWSHH